MKSKKSFVRSLLLQYKCTKPLGQAFSKWQLITSMSIAQSQRQELEDQGNAEIKNLNEQIKLLKLEEEAKEQNMNSKLQSALFGWSARRDKGLKVKVFHRWVQFVVINRYNRMSMDLQQSQPDAELKISPPSTPAPSSSTVGAGGGINYISTLKCLKKKMNL